MESASEVNVRRVSIDTLRGDHSGMLRKQYIDQTMTSNYISNLVSISSWVPCGTSNKDLKSRDVLVACFQDNEF